MEHIEKNLETSIWRSNKYLENNAYLMTLKPNPATCDANQNQPLPLLGHADFL